MYIENFPLNTTVSLITKLFSNFGQVKGVDLPTFDAKHPICRGSPSPKTKGYAFVEFAKSEEAKKACKFFNDLSYILTAASKLLGKSEVTTKLEQSLADNLIPERDHNSQATIDLRESILYNLEFRKLLLVRVMTKHQFQKLAAHHNEQRFQSLVRAAKMLVVS